MSETDRRDGEDGGLPTVLRTLIEQATPAERAKITNALRGRARELVKRMFGLGPYFEHTLEFSSHPLSSREQQLIGRLAGMLNDEVDWLLGSSRFDPKAMLGIPEDEPMPVDIGMALTEIRPFVRIVEDASLQAGPGDFGAKLEERTLHLAPATVAGLVNHQIRSAEDFLSFVHGFPTAVAVAMHWRTEDVSRARDALCALLRGVVSVAFTDPPEPIQHPLGAFPPDWMKPQAALDDTCTVPHDKVKAPSETIYRQVGDILRSEHVRIYLESDRRWTFSTEHLSEAQRKTVEEAGATVVPDFQYGVEQQDNKTAYWIAVKSDADQVPGDWIARLRKIRGLTVEEGANPSRVRVLADATAIAIARVHVGSFCHIEEEVSRVVS